LLEEKIDGEKKMVRCSLCGLKIKEENLDKVYQIIYGESEDGKYIAGKDKAIYYHFDCLDNSNSDKRKPIMVSEEI